MLPKLRFGHRSGFTLIELLIVIAIIAILALVILLLNWRKQIDRAYDVRRKGDLARIRTGFEEYYNDQSCYPPSGTLNSCNQPLSPYLPRIPCDPQSKQPYLYVIPDPNNPCNGYIACAALKDLTDPAITQLGCDPVQGCGWGTGYNYCIAASGSVVKPGFNPNPGGTPTPTPTPIPNLNGNFACSPGGFCNGYDNPALHGCPISWSINCPPGACSNPANLCKN